MMVDPTWINAKVAIDRGALKGLCVTDTERYAPVPDMPTAAEAGLPDVLLTTWTGFYAPKGTPREIVDGSATSHGRRPRGAGAAGHDGASKLMTRRVRRLHRSEKERWGEIIRRGNIKLE